MATLQQQLEALNEAISRGVKSVSYEGKRVDYGTLAEMKSARRDLEARIAGKSGRRARIRLAQPR